MNPLEQTSEWKKERGAEATVYEDPYSMTSEIKPEVRKKELPLRDWEKALAEKTPSGYAAMRVFLEDLAPYVAIPYTIPLIYAKYALPSRRDEFLELDQEDQTRVLLYDALAVSILARWKELAGGVALAYRGMLKKPLGAVGKKLRIFAKPKEVQVVPYEDAVKGLGDLLGPDRIRAYSYKEEIKKRLANKKFGKDEADAVASSLVSGDEGRLLSAIIERKYAGKDMTKAFEEATYWRKGAPYPRKVLKEGLKGEMAEEKLRESFYRRQFEDVLLKEIYRAKAKPKTVELIFKAHSKRVFPEAWEAGELGFKDITPHQMNNILLDMLENKATSWQIAHPSLMASLKPARVVFGAGERVLGTRINIQLPISGSLSRTNRYNFNGGLLFAKMMEQRGAYRSVKIKPTGEFRVKKAKWLTPAVQDEAHKILRELDDLAGQARRMTKGEAQELYSKMEEIGGEASGGAKILIDTWQSYSDNFLYSDYAKTMIPKIFRKAGMTELGQSQIDRMMSGPSGLNYEIDKLFSSLANKNPTEKITGMKEILKKARARLDFEGDIHPYFDFTKTELGRELRGKFKKLNLREQTAFHLKEIEKALSWKKGGFLRYLDNYTTRISQNENILLQRLRSVSLGRQSAFFTKVRQLEKMKGEPVDFGSMVGIRTMAQAKQLHLYDTLGEVITYAESLPPAWVRYTDTYLTGILGKPSVSDELLAHFFTRTYGGLERLMGGEGLWDARRVINLAYTLNNMAYLGGLGFKPFSAVRNLFQTLLTTPVDMGGLKDLGRLVQGWKWAFNPKNRAYIRQIGAIAEFAPEIHLRPRFLAKGKVLFGKELPTLEGTRDAGLWMFRGADRWNRYTTGGAAFKKWDAVLGKWGTKDLELTSRKLGLGKRYDWMEAEIKDLMSRGKLGEAKATYIKDIIADTQYLYGVAEAPTILRQFGAIGRTATIFQSWWMNYGTLLHKWMTTGVGPGPKIERLFTMMICQSMAYMIMEPMWGAATARRSTFLGSFPKEFNEFLLPPSWSPVYHAGAAIMNIQSPEVSSRHAKAVLDSAMIMIPAGLQMKAFYRGAKEEGFEGFSKAILRLK